MANSFSNIGKVPELRNRILFTLGMLAVYRIGVFVTVPGVNRVEMKNLISTGGTGTFLGLFNVFSGGALETLSIFALGIMPYISASIIIQLLTVVVPKLDQLNKEGEQGRRKINQYTRYGTIGLSIVQAVFISTWLGSLGRGGGGFSAGEVVADPDIWFHIMTVLTLTTGTAFLMWLGEQITERGVGNGISLLIFAGIVAAMPDGLTQLFARSASGDYDLLNLVVLLFIAIGTIAAICYFERAHRRIPVQYTKRMVGRKMYAGTQTHLPLKINVSGVIPPIFASSILMFPNQIANMVGTPWMQQVAAALNPNDWRYNVVFVALIIFFTFFYTAVTFNPVDVADNLKKGGGFIPGIRPGKKTAEYIDHVLSRITAAGAVYLAVVCVIPVLLQNWMHVPFYFGGTGLLIVVGVALDTVQQIESHLITRNYEGFTGPKGPRIRGRVSSGRGRR
ncbi:preprotein translocase subunit SecY [Haliangium sp.]|uniref:preprotein translocase subunit SecY n=1 Tax=Haliangium sp. TaxID=2663208 RepID=UPI003D0981B7